MQLAAMFVRLGAETRDFKKGFNDAGNDVRRFERSAGSSFGKIAKYAAIGGAALGVAFAVGAKKAVDAAVDLGEQVNKTGVVFGKSGADVVRWSEDLASSFGISQREALTAAGTFGNMLVPMGFARKEAAGMSRSLVQAASDMASFNNASPAETLEAIRAGVAGESEPLRRFGVFLNDARLKQQALAMGLYKGKGALDAHAKAAATTALIYEDMKKSGSVGDFARTSGSLANQQRILRAELDNATAAIGAGLLPVATKLVSFFAAALPTIVEFGTAAAEWLGPKLAAGLDMAVVAGTALVNFLVGVIGFFQEHKAAVEILLPVLASLTAAYIAFSVVTNIIKAVAAAQMILNAVMAANPLVLVVAAIAGLIAALVILYQRNEAFRRIVQQVWAAIKQYMQATIDFLRNLWKKWGDEIVAVAKVAFGMLKGIVSGIVNVIRGFVDIVVGIFTGDWGRAWQGLQRVAKGAWQLFSAWLLTLPMLVLGWAKDIGVQIIEGIKSGFTGLLGSLKDKLESGLKGVVSGLNPFSPPEHGGYIIGHAMGMGTIRGWIEGSADLPTKMTDTVRKSIEAARAEVEAARGVLTDAWSQLGSDVMAAFDEGMSRKQTPAEKQLAAREEKKKWDDLQAAYVAADDAVAAAQADLGNLGTLTLGQDPSAYMASEREITARLTQAQNDRAAALYNLKTAELQQQAGLERAALDNETALKRRHLAEDLAALQAQAAKHHWTQDQLHQKLLALYKKYKIPFANAAAALGDAIAEGLKDSTAGVERAAQALRQVILKWLDNLTVRITVELQDPRRTGADKQRQHGGPVQAGKWYMVGERGPEMWRAPGTGRIISTRDLMAHNGGGGGGGTTVVNMNVGGNILSERDILDLVRRVVAKESRRTGGAVI